MENLKYFPGLAVARMSLTKAEVWDQVARDNYPLSVLANALELALTTGRKRLAGEKIYLNNAIRCCFGE